MVVTERGPQLLAGHPVQVPGLAVVVGGPQDRGQADLGDQAVPLLAAIALLLSVAKSIVYIIICVVGLFSRDRRRRDDARRLLQIIVRAPRDRPPRS